MKRSAAPILLLLASACAAAQTAQTATFATMPVGIGQHARVGPYLITPRSVIEDSRCPVGVRCIFAGRLIVLAQVDQARAHEVHAFTLGVPLPLEGTALTLTAATPGRFAEISPKATDYRFTFAAGVSG